MHPRIQRRHLAHVLWIVAAFATACATSPPARVETDEIRALREDYLRTFPDGPHNDRIRRGEIVKGMNLFEVLASWGIPDARTVSAEGNQECWVYVLLDNLSLDWIRYDYEFRDNALLDWSTTRNVTTGLGLDTPEERVNAMTIPSWVNTNPNGAPVR